MSKISLACVMGCAENLPLLLLPNTLKKKTGQKQMWQMSRAIKLFFKRALAIIFKTFYVGCGMAVLSLERTCLNWSGGNCLHARKKCLPPTFHYPRLPEIIGLFCCSGVILYLRNKNTIATRLFVVFIFSLSWSLSVSKYTTV